MHPLRKDILNFKTRNRHIFSYVSVFFILTFSIIILSSFKPKKTNTPPHIEDTIYVYDTVYYYDTTYVFDTIYVNAKNKKAKFSKINNLKINGLKQNSKNKLHSIPKSKCFFSLDLLFSPMYAYHSFKSDKIYKNATELNKLSIQESLSKSFGFRINYHKQFSSFSSGISYINYNENFNYLVTDFFLDTILAYKYFTTTETEIDTITFYNIDSLLIGDTVIQYYFDTTRITSLDSCLAPKIDSVEFKRNEHTKNSYTYIEIPLIFNFNFHKNNISISPQIGIISSFFINSKGKIVSLTDYNKSIDIKDEAIFNKINLSLYGGVKINYFLTRRFDFFSTMYFRKNLNSIFIDYPIISRFNTFGLSFGLRYKMHF